MKQEHADSFLKMFRNGDLDQAKALVHRHPELASHKSGVGYPLLHAFVNGNGGHSFKRAHLLIADLLIPARVRDFRDAVLKDRIDEVRNQLLADPHLASAEFTAGRGIAQAIHYWRSVVVGKLLLDAGANIDVLTTVHETPLVLQLRFGTVEGVRFLLDRGGDPNRGSLKHMPSDTMSERIELLLDHDWNINERPDTRTLLHHDANHGHGARVRKLLSYGANPNIKDAAGRTALHLISARGVGGETIRALVKAGADLNARDNEDITPLVLARSAKRQAATKKLIALGAEV
ncbi:Ankyrin repeats (3 copies) [Symmachiella macrocystis]|uniref:Ankyrin repeats (3 copies) n=1 Tax=Symmachiella macrocystis TaxID=2527985 RepID=A0A5C6BNJ7_9PLAN|nr:ankyrin repeat domain-containing protein [Symmachiella macrocystis]TWU12144.1 Ankyrin repeats (3 copies) [Symmachiella macrocystis]